MAPQFRQIGVEKMHLPVFHKLLAAAVEHIAGIVHASVLDLRYAPADEQQSVLLRPVRHLFDDIVAAAFGKYLERRAPVLAAVHLRQAHDLRAVLRRFMQHRLGLVHRCINVKISAYLAQRQFKFLIAHIVSK